MKSRPRIALSRALPSLYFAAFSLAALSSATVASAPAKPSPAALAQPDEGKSEAQIADDIAFAKGLAKEWGFVDLAGEVIKEIERDGVSATTAERLGVVKCEIYAQGAIAERDRTRRNELFEQALAAYDSFLKENPRSTAVSEARAGYIRIASSFAVSLEISMEEALGEEAEKLSKRRMDVLIDANNRTGTLVEELNSEYLAADPKPEALKRDLVNVMMQQAQINLQIGISSEEGTYSFNSARKILESVVFLAGDGSPGALRAYDMIGQVAAAQQDWSDAANYFEAVIEQALPSSLEDWQTMIKDFELGDSDKEQRWLFLELSTGGLVNAKMSSGDVASATMYALHLYNTQRREGFTYSPQLGYPSLLAAARVLLDAGGVVGGKLNEGYGVWYETVDAAIEAGHKRPRDRVTTADLALQIAQQVVSENQGNVLRIKGQKLIADITSRPGIEVDPSVLYEAAEGIYNEAMQGGKDNQAQFVECLDAFKKVLAALEGKDQSARELLGPKTFFRMGRAYQRLERHFEAAMAFREGCTTWRGDPQHDSFNATGFYQSMQELTRQAPSDAVLKTLYQQSETIAADLGTQDQDQILFDKAERLRKAKDYAGAIAAYSQIKASAIDYEKAVVFIGVCEWRMGEKEKGYAHLLEYLNNVHDPVKYPTATGAKEVKRKDALATAGFYRCLHEFGKAQLQKDVEAPETYKAQFQKVVDSSAHYHEEHPDQTSYAPWVMHMVGLSYAEVGQLENAKKTLSEMIEAYPGDNYIAKLAIDLYKMLAKQREDLAQGIAESVALTKEMAYLIELGNQNTSKASADNLRAESKLWAELGDWDKAVPVLEKLVAKFGSDADQEKAMFAYIKPDLAEGYLAQKRVAEAYALLSDLVANETSKPSKRTLMNYTRSVIGWVEGRANEIREVPGAGQSEEAFADACDKLNALANSVDQKWKCEWYSLKFQLAYGYYKWATAEGGPQKSDMKAVANSQLSALIQPLGVDFKGKEGVSGVGQTCDSEPEYVTEFGADVLRLRLVWLWSKVK